MTEYTQITYRVRDSVATITLDRPDRLNAYSFTMARELMDAADSADKDEHVRVVLLTANGRAFCAGADLDPEAGEFSKERPEDELFDDGRPRDAGGMASDLLANATELASQIALDVAPVAFAAAKLMMWGMWSSPDPWEAHRRESRILAELTASDDFGEGVSAFLERRPAKFTGDPQRDLSEAIPAWLAETT